MEPEARLCCVTTVRSNIGDDEHHRTWSRKIVVSESTMLIQLCSQILEIKGTLWDLIREDLGAREGSVKLSVKYWT